MALGALDDRSWAALVVCDGVTSAPDSDRASLAAARAALDVLRAAAVATVDDRASASSDAAAASRWREPLNQATVEAQAATVAIAHALGDPPEAPSCTFVAAVLDAGGSSDDSPGRRVAVAWCGDSRAYWLPDAGEPVRLTTDHSLGTEKIRAGATQAEAESDPQFHTITRWLGADSFDPTSEFVVADVSAPGWLLVCSDGLWNYASSAADIAAQVLAASVDPDNPTVRSSPLVIAERLVTWANAQGGHDNITAALARCD